MTVPEEDRVSTLQFLEATFPNVFIGAGLIPGLAFANLAGGNLDIDAGSLPETMWPGSNLYPWPTAQFRAYVVSTSADDDSPSGIGARTIRVSGLDINYVARTETFIMDGLTDVASAYADWYRINSVEVLTTGTSLTNVGTINVKIGAGASDIVGIIEAGRSLSRQGNYTSDTQHNAVCLGGSVELLQAGSGTEMEIACFTRTENGPWFAGISTSVRAAGSSAYDSRIMIPLPRPPKTDFDMRILTCDANNVRANILMQVLLVDTDLFTL